MVALDQRLKVLIVFGTRPEAIKMAPIVKALQADQDTFQTWVCVTAQHRQMLDQVLSLFEIEPDVDLDLMQPRQSLAQLTSRVLIGMTTTLEALHPDIVLVHGDTTTTMATSLACFYAQIPIGHVEAGLRTYDMAYPFPEEMNRVVTDAITSLYLPPTDLAVENLLKAGARPEAIYKTGNSVIDALFYTLEKAKHDETLPIQLEPGRKMILVTVHRRENFGEPLHVICRALLHVAQEFPELDFVIPVHLNPNVRGVIHEELGEHQQFFLIPPQEYQPFCQLMNQSYFIITDSGGVQEEAPALSKPVLVLRDETERPEAVEMGTVLLVGPHFEAITEACRELMTDSALYNSMAQAKNPYGDGYAAQRTIEALKAFKQSRL
jgi:UDP-N-acetylglucosamine 2-epimerase (non-hydrolysing)